MTDHPGDGCVRDDQREREPWIACGDEILLVKGGIHVVWVRGLRITLACSADGRRVAMRADRDERCPARNLAPLTPKEVVRLRFSGDGTLSVTPTWRQVEAPGDSHSEGRRQDA